MPSASTVGHRRTPLRAPVATDVGRRCDHTRGWSVSPSRVDDGRSLSSRRRQRTSSRRPGVPRHAAMLCRSASTTFRVGTSPSSLRTRVIGRTGRSRRTMRRSPSSPATTSRAAAPAVEPDARLSPTPSRASRGRKQTGDAGFPHLGTGVIGDGSGQRRRDARLVESPTPLAATEQGRRATREHQNSTVRSRSRFSRRRQQMQGLTGSASLTPAALTLMVVNGK